MKFKKTFTLMLCIALLVACLSLPAFAAGTASIIVTADKSSVAPGDTVTYTVYLTNASNVDGGVMAYSYDVSIPNGLTYVSGSCVDSVFGNPSFNGSFGYCMGLMGAGYTGGSLPLATFTCTVDAGAEGNLTVKTYNVTLSDGTSDIAGGTGSATVNSHVCVPVKVEAKAATCEGTGNEAYYKCSCGKLWDANNNPITAIPTIAALGHNMQQSAAAVAPTCTTPGKTAVMTCANGCGHTTGGEVVPALGHTPAEAVKEDEVAATCTAAGSYNEVVYCSVCGEKISSTPKTVPALGHTPAEAVKEDEVAATCTTEGSYNEVVYCSVCGEKISSTPKTVPALGHTPAAAVKENEKAATCTEDGSYDEVVYCSVCDAEISRETKVIKAAHTPAAAVRENEVKGDCQTKHSYDEVVYCSVCKEELSRTKVTGELGGHNYGTDGKCTICGKVKDPNLDNQPDTGDIFVEIALYASFAALAVGAVVFAKRKVRG